MITGEELEAFLEADGNRYVNYRYTYDYGDFLFDGPPAGTKIDVLGLPDHVEVVDAVTGRDGNYQGEDTYDNYIVVKVGDQYFRKTGYFNSWDGGDMDGPWHEVSKVKKTIEVWENKLDY